MIKLFRENGMALNNAQRLCQRFCQRFCQRTRTFFLNELHVKWYSTIERKEKNTNIFLLQPKLKKERTEKRTKERNLKINSETEDYEDLYFCNKLIEKKLADIKIKESHNKILFKFLPLEGRTKTVPISFKIIKHLYLYILSIGVILIHIFSEIEKEQYIRDIWTFEIYFLSCLLSFNGGFNSMLQLIQYAIPANRKHKGLYNSLRFISSLVPLFFSLLCTAMCEYFPKDSLYLLIISYISLLFNYYLLHIKCLVPFWVFREMKSLILLIIFNQFLLLISEAQLYRGRNVSLNLD